MEGDSKIIALNFRAVSRVLAFGVCILVPFFVRAQSAPQAAPGQWRENVTVNSDRVLLADLLQPGAAAQVRLVADKIDLGRSPQPGSYRVFDAIALEHAVEGTGIAAPAKAIVVRGGGWPPSQEQLTVALQAASLPVVPVNVIGSPLMRTPDSPLRVTAMLSGNMPETRLVRFECRERSDCAPFWGEIKSAENYAQIRRTGTDRVSSGTQHRAATLVRPGQVALLIVDQPGMKISLPVLPLARAGMDARLKVFDPKTRRTFLARVKGANLVVSDLEEAR